MCYNYLAMMIDSTNHYQFVNSTSYLSPYTHAHITGNSSTVRQCRSLLMSSPKHTRSIMRFRCAFPKKEGIIHKGRKQLFCAQALNPTHKHWLLCLLLCELSCFTNAHVQMQGAAAGVLAALAMGRDFQEQRKKVREQVRSLSQRWVSRANSVGSSVQLTKNC